MTNRTHSAQARKRDHYRSRPVDSRYEIVFQNGPSPVGLAKRLFRALKSVSDKGGEVVGDVYAIAAGNLLGGWERLEDLNAERRFRSRAAAAPGAEAPLAGLAITTDEIKSTRKASV